MFVHCIIVVGSNIVQMHHHMSHVQMCEHDVFRTCIEIHYADILLKDSARIHAVFGVTG